MLQNVNMHKILGLCSDNVCLNMLILIDGHYERRILDMKYEKAMAEVVEFDNSDVITTSSICGDLHKNQYAGCTELTHPGWDCTVATLPHAQDPIEPENPFG